MPHFVSYWLAFAVAAQAGLVKGVVLEHASGRPLARTLVRLEPVPGTNAKAAVVRTGRAGEFQFSPVPDGLYRILAQRNGYFPTAFGQKLPPGQGMPVQVTGDSDLFTELRLRRMGAITGTVLDENSIGIPGATVLAYRARLPLRLAGRAVSDDRGVYRIAGLDPGKYWVRTAAHTLEDGSGLLPTFGPQSPVIREARVHEVRLDAETPDANIHPDAGTLLRLSGRLTCDRPNAPPVTVTLSSETGRHTMQAGCNVGYAFDGLAPAAYELFATYPDGSASGFAELFLKRSSVLPVQLMAPPRVDFEVRNSSTGSVTRTPVALMGRRDDLSALETAREIMMPSAALAAGHWELNASAGPGQYVESIDSTRQEPRRPWRPERPPEWHDVFIEPRFATRVRITVSDSAAQIAGAVTSGTKPVPGAPVFLWPVTDASRRMLGGWREVLSDIEGRFRFEGLPPGDYRVLATFDCTEVSSEIIEEARTPAIRLAASQTAAVELSLWFAP